MERGPVCYKVERGTARKCQDNADQHGNREVIADEPHHTASDRRAPHQAVLQQRPVLWPSAPVADPQLRQRRDRGGAFPCAGHLRDPREHRAWPPQLHGAVPGAVPAVAGPWRDVAAGERRSHLGSRAPAGRAASDPPSRRRAGGSARGDRPHQPRCGGRLPAPCDRPGRSRRAPLARVLCCPLRRPRAHLGDGTDAPLAAARLQLRLRRRGRAYPVSGRHARSAGVAGQPQQRE